MPRKSKKSDLRFPLHEENLATLDKMAGKLGVSPENLVSVLVNSFAIASAALLEIGEPDASPAPKKRGPKSAKAPKSATSAEPKKRGRPRKVVDPNLPPPVPKKRGRPKKVVEPAGKAPKAAPKAPKATKAAPRAPKAVKVPKAVAPKEKKPEAPKAPRAKKAAVEAPPAVLD